MSRDKKSMSSQIGDKIDSLGEALKLDNLWPVRRKIYKTIINRLMILREAIIEIELKEHMQLSQLLETKINNILKSIYECLSEKAAWDIADDLKELLPTVASDAYLYTLLLDEKARLEKDKGHWCDYFEDSSLQEIISKYEQMDGGFRQERNKVIDRLTALYKFRNDKGRHDRAREGIRARYLEKMAGILAGGILLVLMSWFAITNDAYQTLLLFFVVIAGAIGALLSRALRLRNLNFITEINILMNTIITQAVLGGVLAMIVWLVLYSGVITIQGFEVGGFTVKPSTYFIIGFISGFSEPFALGILERVANIGN